MTTEYRSTLVESVNQLIQIRHRLFGDALNLALLGDLREISDAFDVGDTYKFELSHLKDSADANLNKLVTLIEEIQTTVETLIEENEIEEDEIQWEHDEPEDSGSSKDPGRENDQPAPKQKNVYKIDPKEDQSNPAYIFNWVITYGDGTQELFRGFSDEAFEYALTKSKKFSVEKAEVQDEPAKHEKALSENMSMEELCKAHGIPYKNNTKELAGQTTLMFSGARKNPKEKQSLESVTSLFFDDSSKNLGRRPKLTILTGSVRSGKTTLRKEEYSQGYVLVDAAEIFSTLCHGKKLVFPSTNEKSLNMIGLSVALRAIKERRNIVTEIIGEDPKEMESLVVAAKSIGYKIILVLVLEDGDKPGKRKTKEKISNISAYACEPYHIKWILSAIRKTRAYEKSKQ